MAEEPVPFYPLFACRHVVSFYTISPKPGRTYRSIHGCALVLAAASSQPVDIPVVLQRRFEMNTVLEPGRPRVLRVLVYVIIYDPRGGDYFFQAPYLRSKYLLFVQTSGNSQFENCLDVLLKTLQTRLAACNCLGFPKTSRNIQHCVKNHSNVQQRQ